MPQRAKAIDSSSCPLYYVNEVFCYLLRPFELGIRAYEKKKVGDFIIHWSALLILFYGFCFMYYFSCIFVFFTHTSKSHALILVRGVSVEAGPRQESTSGCGQAIVSSLKTWSSWVTQSLGEGPTP